jgi:hypothetical protein
LGAETSDALEALGLGHERAVIAAHSGLVLLDPPALPWQQVRPARLALEDAGRALAGTLTVHKPAGNSEKWRQTVPHEEIV